jgi:hypothetical protein
MDIVFALEEWDSILDYHRPNASSKTWYLKEVQRVEIPKMLGRWCVFDENGAMHPKEVLKEFITPDYTHPVTYRTMSELGDDPFIYPIFVHAPEFFTNNRHIGLSCISEGYLDAIRRGRGLIVIFCIYEGFSGMVGSFGKDDFGIIEEWRINSKLPDKSIFYLSGNLLSEKIVKERGYGYEAKGVSNFEQWNRYEGGCVKFKPNSDKHLFLSYNRQLRSHRLLFALELLRSGLLFDGLVSLNHIDFDVEGATAGENLFFRENTPLTIETVDTLKYNLAVNITVSDHEQTFMSVVTETLVGEGTLFLSEKIWKPIMLGHPFMVYGNKGTLEHLRKLGYRTFDKWFDESYDTVPDHRQRCTMIVNELARLKTKSVDELKVMRDEMRAVCSHNQRLFRTICGETYAYRGKNKTINDTVNWLWSRMTQKGKKFI